ncbi:MAG: beta-lactamase family protein [Nitrosomonadales bacterium]|nr:beta-lactamase family protein [Nitrosomonadales bacterium]
MSQRFIPLVLTATLLSACSSTAPIKPADLPRGDYAYTQRYLTWLIEKEMDDNDVTGLSIALVDDQRVVWSSGFGYSDAEKRVPATPQTPYRMGSIAKIMTASAAMQMAEHGQIDIDQPLSRYLPEFAIKSRFDSNGAVTPRNIMTHHSGLPSNYLKGMTDNNPKPISTLVADTRDEYAAYPPNFIFAYSNLGMTLLGAAIEQTSGQDYSSYMKQSLFEPLGMRNTYFASQPALNGYNAGKLSRPLPLRDLPSGGLVSNVDDLARFMKMVFAGGRAGDRQILEPETLREMLRPQNASVPLDLNFRMGLGWMLSGFDVRNGGVVAGHGGSLLDFHSLMLTLPEHRLGVIVASNSASSIGAVNKIAAEALKVMLEAKSGIAPPAESPRDALPPTRLSPQMIDAYTGYFDTVVGLVKVSNRSGDLNAEVMGHTFELPPQGDGWLGIKYKLMGLIPVSVSALDELRLTQGRVAGRDVLVGKIGNETTIFGEKLQKAATQQWLTDYVGKYELITRSDGPVPGNISLRNEDGMFIGECTFAEMPNFVLRVGINPISENEAVISGLGSGRGETIRMIRDQSERRLVFSGFELRRVN